ncbi:PqqD family protein [Terrisporobacter petrolearius]|uniref:PqqD family protein n=1 Tax=Terrisporobacter petrolearius TaxID=1460447 RepID=UPI0031CCCA55
MEVKKDFNLRKMAGEYVLMPKNTSQRGYNGLISLNEVEALVWKNLEDCKSEEDILSLITNTYMVKKSDAKKDLGDFLEQLEEADII